MPGNPPAWQGIDPFLQRWDFSQPNEAYFAHADEVLKLARERGMLVTLVPAYLGYPDDPTQGWADELQWPSNSVDKSEAYGRFLGRRYKDFDNIIWVAGGDNLPPQGSELEAHMRAIMSGIRADDSEHLWTAHWSGTEAGSVSSDNPTFAADMDIDGYYAFNYPLTYERDLDVYARAAGKPFIHLDMSYETEWGGDAASIRRRAYDALLSGAVGSSFNAGPDWYLFRNIHNMDTTGTVETQHWFKLFSARPWYELEPDVSHSFVSDGYGQRGTADYVCAASTADSRLIVAYLPNGGSVTVNLEPVPAMWARVSWYDPTAGRMASTSDLLASGYQVLQAPRDGSWVLVVEAKL
jgi:hypothetical protein